MLIFSKAFVALTGFMFAVLLLFAAMFQLFLLLFGSRPARLSNWFFLVPTALVGAAVFIFMHKPDTAAETVVMTTTGLSFIVFGVFTVVEGSIVAVRITLFSKPPRTAERGTQGRKYSCDRGSACR